MLAVVIADVAVEGEYQFQRRKVATSPSELCRLADWLVAEQVEEIVMESTAQYWRPVWATLEQRWGGPNGLEKAPEPGRANCIWRRHSQIEEQRDGRRIFQTRNDSSSAWSLRN